MLGDDKQYLKKGVEDAERTARDSTLAMKKASKLANERMARAEQIAQGREAIESNTQADPTVIDKIMSWFRRFRKK